MKGTIVHEHVRMVRQAFSISNTDTLYIFIGSLLYMCVLTFVRMHGHKFRTVLFHNQCQSLCLEIVPEGGRGEFENDELEEGMDIFSMEMIRLLGGEGIFLCLLANDP